MLTLPRAALLASCMFLTSCGVTYNSPKVSDTGTAYDVSIISMTPATVARANTSSYKPKRLPAAFSQIAGGTSVSPGQLPKAPKGLKLRLPPPVEATAYKIGVGDVILVATRRPAPIGAVEQTSSLSAAQSQRQPYTVRDDGAIAIPEVGAVAVEGLTIEEAEERVFQRLVQNQLDPEFSLEIAEFNSKRVSIDGAVQQSQLVPVTLNPLHLDEAITAAGGISPGQHAYASIRIHRGGRLYQIPLANYYASARVRKTVLRDGDSVFVDNAYEQRRAELEERRANFQSKMELGAVARDHVYLTGEVSEQSRIALPFEVKSSLADVFYENGGFPTVTGNPAQIYVLRSNGEALTAYHLNAKNIVNVAMATNFEMRPNDIIFVQEQPITTWGRALQQAFPLLLNTGAASLQ
ncbi:polysaccharide biosynthesis/export family protein [Thalassobius sp. Cn5-15]|jgi:polysaccharide export outer membrane protein|uniref:polysaccharide biosynthesis/export family protein n=1 Tax=Thalassobius sp. Cn5-15 TaxID=2917763 RepID=UPI001EF1E901|nr:polysaccharide biosynthesis/export family protein [Thalassobius sp. Cn5-15]MCG7494991.1 polysaccharide biosynthesis/export family protein [Thalassobius sp. Cn5-15]